MRYIKTFEKFDKVAFHGYKMKPQDMRLTDCEVEWKGPDQDTGCPLFSNENRITEEDLQKAITFLNEEDVRTIIGYSRGGAILLSAFNNGAKIPNEIYLVAPAWSRQWADINPMPINKKGYIIHGGKDDKVPLKHSAILSKATGLTLYVFPDCNHINILKNKDNIEGGIKVNNIDEAISILPDWGKIGSASPEELNQQIDWCSKLSVKSI